MRGKALILSLPSIVVAAGGLCWLAPLQGLEAFAEAPAGYPSASAQVFDATPMGGVLHTISRAHTSANTGKHQDVKAQIFDPEVFGSVRSKFSNPAETLSDLDASRSTIEGRSVGTSDKAAPVRTREISPGPARQCEPGPAAAKFELQYGALERNPAA